MASTKKTKYLAETSAELFVARNMGKGIAVYFWTFSFVENLTDKDEAERRLKPFRDLVRRRGGEMLVFWEPQARGAWHPHIVVNMYFDVNLLRPWMMRRGWGPQMRVEKIQRQSRYTSRGWVNDDQACAKLVRYLSYYLTKTVERLGPFKKPFGGSQGAKLGNTNFKWTVLHNPYDSLRAWGRRAYQMLFGEIPSWRVPSSFLVRLGYEYCDYGEFDPFYLPP